MKLIFGNKSKFAFEIEQGVTGIKGCMKIWIKNNSIGDFKKQDEYINIMYDIDKFNKTYEYLYEPIFDEMTIEEIQTYLLAEDLIWSDNPESLEEAKRRQIYTRFFGVQFDGLCSFNSLYKEGNIIWIVWYYNRKKDEYSSFKIQLEDYQIATSEFTKWFNINLAKFYL